MYVDEKKNTLWKDVNFVICKNCGLVFENPRMSFESMKNYYSKETTSSTNYAIHQDISFARKDQFKFLRKYSSSTGKLLDIGSGHDAFLDFWLKDGFVVYSLEPGTTTKDNVEGLTIINQYYEEYATKDKFNIISMRHVLEHSFSPSSMIIKAWNELEDNGILFIEVPNLYDPFITITPFFEYPHTFNFSPVTLRTYLNKLGFTVIKYESLSYNAMRFIAQKTTKNSEFKIENDYNAAKVKIEEYAVSRNHFLNEIKRNLKRIKGKTALFGAGDHSMFLIGEAELDISKINCFIDSHPSKQGKYYFGLPIYSPDVIGKEKFDTVIVSSYAYQDEIVEMI
ncbi:MAG: methyltransferase domain-containing protein, partial [Patescibacteria group bacterium]|nr:methyltransferase domain-containing protein [Patescibacteria group bacterium]